MKLGPYEVLNEIGRGGMGVVYRGRAPDGRIVAVKCLLQMSRGDNLARFDRERRLLSTLGDEEGFVPLLDFGDSPRGPFIIMPFLGGGTLRGKLQNGPLPLGEAIALTRTLAVALGRAHAQGVVHRDLKPENVLFTDDGRPLVSDLGLAKHFNRDSPGASQSIALSKVGEIRGTAGYMAPEQMDDAGAVGPPADVFALGAMAYECFTGDPAFEGDNMAEILGRVISGSWTPLRNRRPEIPRGVARVIERTLSARSADRYPDATAFANALDGKRDPNAPRRWPRIVAALALLALLGGGGVFLAGRGGGAEGRAASPGAAVESSQTGKMATKAKLVATWGSLEWRHQGPVLAVTFAHDGKFGASASEDRTVKIWDLATGRAVRTLEGHSRAVTGVAFTPDAKRVVSSSEDGTVRLWEIATGKPIWTRDEKPDRIRAVAISRDGARVATCGSLDHVTVYETQTGLPTHTIHDEKLEGSLAAITFLPGKDQVVATSDDNSLRVFDLQYGLAADVLRGHVGPTLCIAAGPDGDRIASGGSDHAIIYREPNGREIKRLLGHSAPVTGVAVSGDGKRVLSCSTDRTLRVWDVEKGSETLRLEGHVAPILACAFSPDGRRALSGGADHTVRLWDLAEEKQLSRLEGHCASVTGIAFLPDQKRAVTGGLDGSVLLWDVATGKRLKTLVTREPRSIAAVGVLSKSLRPVTGATNGVCALWDFEFGCEWFSYSGGHTAGVTGVATAPGLDTFVTASADGKIRTFDAASPRGLESKEGHAAALSLAGSRDGRRALSGGSEGRIVLWNTEKGLSEVAEVGSLATAVTAAALSVDTSRALTGGGDGVVSLWDVTAKTRVTLAGHEGPITSLAFARSERIALSASEDGSVRVWDLAAKRQIDRIDLGDDRPLVLAVLTDGRSFLVGTKRALVLRYELEAESK